jgi:hypothetical protein
MPKLDLLKECKSYYKAGRKPEIVEFGEVSYLAIEGKGEPAGEMFVAYEFITVEVGYSCWAL